MTPEQVELTQETPRSLSECDMERNFGKVSTVKDEQSIRATLGLAEYERTLGEIFQALMPTRSMPGMRINEEECYFRNFYWGACLDLEENWKKYFPEYWEIVTEREEYRQFAKITNHDILKMKAVLINPSWKRLIICRSIFAVGEIRTVSWLSFFQMWLL